MKLIPPDKKQCQALGRAFGVWNLFPNFLSMDLFKADQMGFLPMNTGLKFNEDGSVKLLHGTEV